MSEKEFFSEARHEDERKFSFGTASAASEKHPKINEDSFLESPEKRVFAVFDGMGGHSRGDIASGLAKESLAQFLETLPAQAERKTLAAWLKDVLAKIDQRITKEGDRDFERYGMGTAGSVLILGTDERGDFGLGASAADTRIWLFHGGELKQVTVDNVEGRSTESDVEQSRNLQTKLNSIRNTVDLGALSLSERVMFDRRNVVSNYLGSGDHNPRVETFDLQRDDRILLSSDGIHDNLTAKEVSGILLQEVPAKTASELLLQTAQKRSKTKSIRAEPDDMTALIIDIAQ